MKVNLGSVESQVVFQLPGSVTVRGGSANVKLQSMIIQAQERFQGAARDCAVATMGGDATTEEVSLLEHRVNWDQDGCSGFVIDVTLRCSVQLCVSQTRARDAQSFAVQGTPTDLMFTLSRGTGATLTLDDGTTCTTGGGALEITQIKRPVTLHSSLSAGSHNEYVILSLKPERMCSLLGIFELPALAREVATSSDAYCRVALPMGVELFRLLDEMLACATAGSSRQLYLEGKGLEILARIFDELNSAEDARTHQLSPSDVERLQEVKKTLLAKLEAPPSLAELARQVGMGQTKLKAGFRSLFGAPIYSYLRDLRMTEAHRLLLLRDLSVTEVAARIGYANPSKFAAAFRKHFGISPSSVGHP